MLDVWGSQTAESALTWQMRYHTTSYSWTYPWSYSWICSWTCAWDKDHDIFTPGSCSKSLSLTKNQYRRGRYVLGIVQGQDHDSLGVVQRQGHDLRAHLTVLHFLDPTLSLRIKFSFPFWYHNHYSLTRLVILGLNSARSFNLACLLEVGQEA
jgi:hypothetical protein